MEGVEDLPIKILIFFVSLVVLYVVAIPIHEICHFLFAKAVGCQNKLEINLLKVASEGDGVTFGGRMGRKDKNEPWFFSPHFHINYKTLIFLLGLSGGFGTALIMSLVGFLLLFLVPQLGSMSWKPLAVVVGFHAIYGIIEGRRVTKEDEFLNGRIV